MKKFNVTDVADTLEAYLDLVGKDPVWIAVDDLTRTFNLEHQQVMKITHYIRHRIMDSCGVRGRVYILSKSKPSRRSPTLYLITRKEKIISGCDV